MDSNVYVVNLGLLLLAFASLGHFSDVERELRKIKFRINTLKEALNMRNVNIQKEIKLLEFETEELRNDLEGQKNRLDQLETLLHMALLKTTPAVVNRGLKELEIGSSSTFYPRGENESTPFITGTEFLPDGQLVVCDYDNGKIKLLSSDFTETGKLIPLSRPWDVAAVNSTTVIVTLPFNKQLQYVHVKPGLQLGNIIELDKKCFGVDVSGDEIFISCHNNPGAGEIRVLDMDGTLKRRLGASDEQNTSYMFISPSFVAVSASTGNIYVSDWETDKVTCISDSGEVMYQFEDPELKDPSGMYIDVEDYLIVCGTESDTVLVITDSGKKDKTLITLNNHVMTPISVAFRQSDKTLVVGFWYGFQASKLIPIA